MKITKRKLEKLIQESLGYTPTAQHIFMLIGPPSIGKSTWIRENVPDAFVISSDETVEAAAKKAGKDFVVDSSKRKEIIEKVIKNKKLQVKENIIPFLKGTIATDSSTYNLTPLEHGGTAHAGKAHLVGEKGPEVFIPKETGEVVANDDTQVFSMLLAANPQLQKVSKERAMKILKAKFPEYFD